MHKQVRIFLTIPLNSLMLIATWIFKNINRYSNPAAFLFSLVLLFLCNDLPLSLQLLTIIKIRKWSSQNHCSGST